MKYKLKRMIVLAAGVLGVMLYTLPAMAGEKDSLKKANTEAETAVEDTYVPRTRGRVFVKGYIQLTDLDGKAGIHGETLAAVDADEVGLYLYLEKYNGTSFDSYQYWKTVEYNASKNIKGYTISVPKGYYYRLRGYHYVDADGIFENGSTMTDGLKIPQ